MGCRRGRLVHTLRKLVAEHSANQAAEQTTTARSRTDQSEHRHSSDAAADPFQGVVAVAAALRLRLRLHPLRRRDDAALAEA